MVMPVSTLHMADTSATIRARSPKSNVCNACIFIIEATDFTYASVSFSDGGAHRDTIPCMVLRLYRCMYVRMIIKPARSP